jgi:hypothetical protein
MIDQLQDIRWSYILGDKMRNSKEVQAVVGDDEPFFELTPSPNLPYNHHPSKAEDVVINNNRYIKLFNDSLARQDYYDREIIISHLEEAWFKDDKSLIEQESYKRFAEPHDNTFVINFGKILNDEKYDRKIILKTDVKIPAAEVASQYIQLLNTKTILRDSKSLFDTCPIYYQRDDTIVSHIYVSLLAFFYEKY